VTLYSRTLDREWVLNFELGEGKSGRVGEGESGRVGEGEKSSFSPRTSSPLTDSIQDTSPRIPSFADSGPRNKKPVSDETCPPNLSVGSRLQSKI
jgi:hypothetical protein